MFAFIELHLQALTVRRVQRLIRSFSWLKITLTCGVTSDISSKHQYNFLHAVQFDIVELSDQSLFSLIENMQHYQRQQKQRVTGTNLEFSWNLYQKFSHIITYPAGLNDLMVTIETVLNLHQLLEVILKENKNKTRKIRGYTYRSRPIMHISWLKLESGLTPCFIMSLAWFATSFTMLRAAVSISKTKHRCLAYF